MKLRSPKVDKISESDAGLPGMYLVSVSRGTNSLLEVGPDKHGRIPEKYLEAKAPQRDPSVDGAVGAGSGFLKPNS